jgi:hypothetical protein
MTNIETQYVFHVIFHFQKECFLLDYHTNGEVLGQFIN